MMKYIEHYEYIMYVQLSVLNIKGCFHRVTECLSYTQSGRDCLCRLGRIDRFRAHETRAL